MENSFICNYLEKQYNQRTMIKRAHDSQIVRAKENLKLSHGGPSYSQASGANLPLKALRQSRH